jgi:hypothetical protein
MYCRNRTGARASRQKRRAQARADRRGADHTGCAQPGLFCRSPDNGGCDPSHGPQCQDELDCWP